MEREFASCVIAERARLFCCSAIIQLRIELVVRELSATRSLVFILLRNEVLLLCRTLMNERIALQSIDKRPVEMEGLYCYVSVLLLPYLTSLSFLKIVEVFGELNCTVPALDRVRFISTNILAFSATGRCDTDGTTWNAQRDQTPYLSSFAGSAFHMRTKVFPTPVHIFATLDDELYGARASDNQVKT